MKKKFPADTSGRGDDRSQEGVTQAWSRVALPMFINLRLCPLREREVKVLMTQGASHRGWQMETRHDSMS